MKWIIAPLVLLAFSGCLENDVPVQESQTKFEQWLNANTQPLETVTLAGPSELLFQSLGRQVLALQLDMQFDFDIEMTWPESPYLGERIGYYLRPLQQVHADCPGLPAYSLIGSWGRTAGPVKHCLQGRMNCGSGMTMHLRLRF